jgi:hypothetical protein
MCETHQAVGTREKERAAVTRNKSGGSATLELTASPAKSPPASPRNDRALGVEGRERSVGNRSEVNTDSAAVSASFKDAGAKPPSHPTTPLKPPPVPQPAVAAAKPPIVSNTAGLSEVAAKCVGIIDAGLTRYRDRNLTNKEDIKAWGSEVLRELYIACFPEQDVTKKEWMFTGSMKGQTIQQVRNALQIKHKLKDNQIPIFMGGSRSI